MQGNFYDCLQLLKCSPGLARARATMSKIKVALSQGQIGISQGVEVFKLDVKINSSYIGHVVRR